MIGPTDGFIVGLNQFSTSQGGYIEFDCKKCLEKEASSKGEDFEIDALYKRQ